jgi:hypothetical protein
MSNTLHQTIGMETVTTISCNTILGSGFNAIHADRAINRGGHLITLSLKLDGAISNYAFNNITKK